MTPVHACTLTLTCNISFPLVGALFVRVSRHHTLGRVFSLQASGNAARQPVAPYTVQLVPRTPATSYHCGGNGWAGLRRSHPGFAGVELPLGSLVTPLALLVQSVVAGVGCMGRAGHQTGAGEVRVGQELGLLVEGERGLLVGRLQIGPWDPGVRIPHAAPDRAAGMGASHAAAGWLIHGDAKTLHTLFSKGLEVFSSRRSVSFLRKQTRTANLCLCLI